MTTDVTVERPGRVPPTRPEGFGPPDLLRTMFTHPRATVRWVLDCGDGGLWILFLLGMVAFLTAPTAVGLVGLFAAPPLSITNPSGTIAFVAAISAAQVLCLLAGAWGVSRVIGGRGSLRETVVALAWSALPVVASLPVMALPLAFGTRMAPALILVCNVTTALLAVGTCILAVPALAEAQRFSRLRGAFALVAGAGVAYLLLTLFVLTVLPFLLFGLGGGVD